ncbi:MAG: beta-lactamase family protein [Myxococcales bacterium]|nr:beta-lactamase family protein [Myxococcales bacterium]
MRPIFLALLVACSSSAKTSPLPIDKPEPAPVVTSPPTPDAAAKKEVMAADTPRTTVTGNGFVVPAGWAVRVSGPATIVEGPEADSWIALVDVKAKDAEAAVVLAWDAYKPDKKWQVERAIDVPDRDGWTRGKQYIYRTSPNEKRIVAAGALFANEGWTVIVIDVAEATASKRGGQISVIFDRLLPKGGAKESFAGKRAHPLDKERIAKLEKFVEDSMKVLGTEAVAFGLVENGKTVFAGGFGRRQLGKPAKVDENTKFMVGSNTKALTTLMLGKLVDENKLTWESAATSLLPSFKLGDADTTSKVLVKHLICACTGMPRQDVQWILEHKDLKPDAVMTALGEMQPTSKFGELFQYSNFMAAAAGYVGGHVAYPKLELGAAYDKAMQDRVFGPLGMKATSLDHKRAQAGNFALPFATDLDGKLTAGPHALNSSVIGVRPAGAAWSTVNDMLAYIKMELAEGKLPNGKQYISKESLLSRRAPQVAIGKDNAYGMGLGISNGEGVQIIGHTGGVFGFQSNMFWLPEHGIGVVILTNSDRGGVIHGAFQRKLLEVLFDGKPEADESVVANQKQFVDGIAIQRKQLVIPADATEAGKLAAHYTSTAAGDIKVVKQGATTVFDFGEFTSEVASKKNPDGSISYVTLSPGFIGVELVGGGASGKRTLTLREAQHEYVFTEK